MSNLKGDQLSDTKADASYPDGGGVPTEKSPFAGPEALLFFLPFGLWFLSHQDFLMSAALYVNLWALSVVDWRTFRLPNLFTAILVAMGLLIAFSRSSMNFEDHLYGMIAGFLVPMTINLVYRLIRNRDGMGLGDAKLLAGAGAWLGWMMLPIVLLAASVGGLVFALVQKARGRGLSMQEKIPFGPFICLAFWVVWLKLIVI